MSAYSTIVCESADADGERCWTEDSPPGSARTATAARRKLAQQGWHRTKEGRDICPDCWQNGRR